MTEHKIKDGVLVLYPLDSDTLKLWNTMVDIAGAEGLTAAENKGEQHLGTLSDLTELQASELVEEVYGEYWDGETHYEETFYSDYTSQNPYKDTALDSLRSLIESKGMNPEQTILIKRKEKK